MSEPIRYSGPPLNINRDLHDGGLEPAVGVHSYQVLRGNRSHPPDAHGCGHRYNHQPMLTYWQGRFYVQYLAAPRNEHDDCTETLLTSSPDGRHWDTPHIIFPAIEYEARRLTIAHQRVGFYVAQNGRLLTHSFYGIPKPGKSNASPNYGYGIGRAIREIYPDGSCGPIYFLRYMPKAGYDEERCNQFYPSFSKSSDPGFVEACQAILDDKLYHQQMWEEDRDNDDGFFALHWDDGAKYVEGKAFSYWTCPDGTTAAIWKGPNAAISHDRGETWTTPVPLSTIDNNTSKYWGQRTVDGKYALVYTSFDRNARNFRTPLVALSGEDGLDFDRCFLVTGEVPLQRYVGVARSIGPQYVRGIVEGHGTPPGNCFWVVYSMSKEDIWVSKIPVPLTESVEGPVEDDFSDTTADIPDRWNLYSGVWTPIRHGEAGGRCALVLEDRDPYNYAKAERVLPESDRITLSLDILISGEGSKPRQVDICGRQARRPVRLELVPADITPVKEPRDSVRRIKLPPNTWTTLSITVDCKESKFEVKTNDGQAETYDFAEPCEKVRRIELRTGHYRMADDRPWAKRPFPMIDLPDADEPVPPVQLAICKLISKC